MTFAHALRALCAGALVLVVPCAPCPAAESAAPSPTEHLARLADATESVRGLKFKEPVRFVRMGEAAALKVIEGELDQQLPPDETAKRVQLLAYLGLLPPDYPLRDKLRALLGEQVLGFYVPQRKQLVVIELGPEKLAALQAASGGVGDPADIVLVHELDHALNDQRFDLGRILEDPQVKRRDDVAFARQALAEGDATLTMLIYAFRGMGLNPSPEAFPSGDALRALMQGVGPAGFPEFAKAPPFVRAMLMEPYSLGIDYVTTLWRKGGWKAVDAAWAAPPSSTEQLMHPDRRSDPPRDVAVNVPAGWTEVIGTDLGELGIRTWLGDDPLAAKVADGWGGDRAVLIEQPRRPQPGEKRGKWPEKDRALLLVTTWDTREDADEFAAAAERWLRRTAKDEDDWRIDQAQHDVRVFFHRALVPEEIVDPIGHDPWDRPASTLEKPK